MAFIQCEKCGKQYSQNAPTCPNCEKDKNKPKRYLIALVFMVFCITVGSGFYLFKNHEAKRGLTLKRIAEETTAQLQENDRRQNARMEREAREKLRREMGVAEAEQLKYNRKRAIVDEKPHQQQTSLIQRDNNQVCVSGYKQAKQDLKKKLSQRYPDSYSTIKMLLDSGMKDYKSICRLPNSEISYRVLAKLNDKYYPSFSTIWMLYQSNMKDYESLRQ